MQLLAKCNRAKLVLAGMLALGTGHGWASDGALLAANTAPPTPRGVVSAPTAAYSDPDSAPFFVRGLSNKCIDAGIPEGRYAGQPVVLADCNGTPAQHIDIVEVSPERHEVILKASDYCIGPKDGALKVGVALELQLCDNTAAPQRFGIDGDSIISFAPLPYTVYARSRLVAMAMRGKWANGSPVVLAERMLDDSEFWTFVPVFGPLTNAHGEIAQAAVRSGGPTNAPPGGFRQKPTTGFATASTLQQLKDALSPGGMPAKPGTVIELTADMMIDDTIGDGLIVPEGVTVRGGRRGLQPGARISYPEDFSILHPVFIVNGADARVTGLRILGPSADRNPDLPRLNGILVQQNTTNMPYASRTVIDHNDLSQFTNASVRIEGGPDNFGNYCLGPRDYHLLSPNVQVVRNYIHHNRSQGEGYGVEISAGAHVLIQGNTFEENRHAIASTFDPRNEYYAYGNLVMPGAPRQEIASWLKIAKAVVEIEGFGTILDFLAFVPDGWYTHDFDVHGSGAGNTLDFEDGLVPPHAGGEAGKNFDIGGNTFLGDNRENLDLRGTPCLGAAFYNNVTRRSQGDAVTDRSNGNIIRIWGNKFGSADPTKMLGTGDFDGDGKPDLFMATGAAWYYRPAGTLEWRFLNDSTLTLDQITLQDVDGDGRTDAVYQIGYQVFTSWGASSPGEVTFEFPAPPQNIPPEPKVPPHGQRP